MNSDVSNPYLPFCFFEQSANRDYYSQYMTEDFNAYVNRKRLGFTHGNHIEIQAMCEMFNRSIEVFCYGKGKYCCATGLNSVLVPLKFIFHLALVRYEWVE